MGERSGAGVVELVLLQVLEGLGARAGRPHVASKRVLAGVEDRIGLAPGYAYQVLADLARPWQVPVRLVDGQGDFGDLRDDQPASHFRHTEARLSPAGEVVLAAERGDLAPVPVGLINGSAYRDGPRPPFRPERVIGAVRQVMSGPGVSDVELVEAVGMPDFLTGCAVTGDLAVLAAGRPAVLRLRAKVSVTADPDVLAAGGPAVPRPQAGSSVTFDRRCVLVEHMPPNASRPRVMQEIFDVGTGRARSSGRGRLPLQNMADISRSGDDRFLCIPDPGTAPELLRDLLQEFEGITTTVTVQLARPLPDLLRAWVRAHQDEDLLASLASLESAVYRQRPASPGGRDQ